MRIHRIPAADGVTLTVEEHGGPAGTLIVLLPALGVPLAYYRPFFDRWAARGRHLAGVELRGQPQSPVPSLRRPGFGYAHLVRHDLPAVFAAAPLAAAERIVLVGHSLGGHLALLGGASGAFRADAVATVATGTSAPVPSATRRQRLSRHAAVRLIAAVSGTLGYWPGHRLGFGGRQPAAMMRDWAHEGRHGRYRLAGDPTDYEAALAGLRVPARLITIEDDPMVPDAAVGQLAARLPRAVVTRSAVRAGGDHFRWVRRHPDALIDDLEGWLAQTPLA